MEDIFQERLIRQGNQNISDNVGVNPDQQLADTDKANALGVRVTDYQGNRDSYNARAAQTSTNLYAAGPVLQKFYANREKQLLIANDLPEFDRLDFTEKVFSTLKQGWNQFGVNVETEDAIDAARRFKDPLGTFMSENQGEGELENAWAQIPDRIRNAFSDKLQLDSLKQLQKEAEDLAVANRFAQVVKPPKVLERWENAKGWDQASEAFWSDPLSMIGYVGGTSLAQQFVPMLMSMPAFAFSPLAGAAASGAGSAYTEYLSSFAEKMSESGVNLTDRDAIVQFMLDPTKFAEAQEFASQRAGGVGLWDAVGGLVAATPFRFVAGTRGFGRQVSRALRGRHTAPLQRTKIARAIDRIADNSPIMSKFDAILSQTTVGGFLGGVGEFTAQMASGQETNWGDIFLEAIGEFFTMPAEIASAQTGIAMSKAKEFRHVQVAKKASKLVTDLAKVASISNLRGRKPEVFKETIKEMGENSQLKEVYVRGSDISNELGQSILEVAPELGAALEEARKTGGDLVIPMDILLGSLSDDMKIINGIKDHIRISQDGMSVAEADAWVAENRDFMNRHFDAVFNAQIQKEEYRKELQTAVDPMAAQLNVALRETMAKRYAETGLMTEADAIKRADEVTTHSMRLFGAQLARVSTLLGMTPKQFMERYPNQVQYLYESLAADAESGALGQRVSPAKFSDAAINKGLAEDHRYTRKYASVEAMKMDPEAFEKNVSIMADITGMKQVVGRLRKPEKKAEAIIERMADNLLWIYNQMPEAIRERARLWYEGGHKSVILWANRYGIRPRQAAAIIAAYSPQNGWFNNFTQAERTLDIYFSDARDFKADDKLNERLKELCTGADEARYETMKGKSLADLLAEGDLRSCAIWIRAYDSVFHDSRYRVQTPEGGVGNDWAKTAKGNNSRVVWMRYTPVIKALSILIDGSQANIDEQIGNDFKVRDFYNNLYDPTDEKASTIDTHQVGANLLSVMSSNSREVTQNFGGVGSAGSVITGQKGTYAFHAEALARAAERVGVLPREMQSITWEGIRVLFPDVQKKSLRPKIEAIWNRHDKGEITLNQARQEILDVTGGFGKYAWEDTPFNDVPQPSYERGDVNLVHRQDVVPEPVLAIEAAPDPRNAEAVAKWDELTADEKYIVTKNVVAYVLDRVALATKTRISEVGLQVGGWLGDVNFSATAEIADGGDAVGVAKLVARLLHQQAVMVISGTKQEGMFDSKVITIKLPEGMTPDQIGDFYKNYIDSVKGDDGNAMVKGMSTANGFMRIVLDEGDDSAKIYDALIKSIEGYPGDVTIVMSDAFVSFASGEDANGSESSQGVSEGLAASRNDHYDSLQGQVDQYFNEQVERAKANRQTEEVTQPNQLYQGQVQPVVVEATSAEISAAKENRTEFRNAVKKLIADQFPEGLIVSVQVESDGREVLISKRSAFHSLDNRATWKTMLAVLHLYDLVKNSVRKSDFEANPHEGDPNRPDAEQIIGGWTYQSKIRIDGTEHTVNIRIARHSDGKDRVRNAKVIKTPDGYLEQLPVGTGVNRSPLSGESAIIIENADQNVKRFVEFAQTAWHGSPYVFDMFSLEHIGSGEGAQAHGWGLYFALNRKTAEGYRSRLADDGAIIKVKNYEFDENDMSDESPDVMAYHTVAWLINEAGPYSFGDFEEIRAEAINIINNAVTFGADKEDAAKAIELVKALTTDDVVIDGSIGRLFKVEIPDADVMLDEDKAFKDQPEFVQKAVRELYKKLNTKRSVRETAQASVAAALVERSKIVESIQKMVADGVLEIDGNQHPQAIANSIEWALMSYLERALNRESLPLWEYRYRQRELVVAEIGLSGSAEAINNIDFDIETLMMEAEQAFGMDHEDMPGAGSRVNLYINPEKTGSDIYDDLTTALGSPKEASLSLNSVGVKGIMYDGRRDGPCAVVFDDKAIRVLEFYQAQMSEKRRAAYNPSEGVTRLFKMADESSFIHESAHYWLNTLALICGDIVDIPADQRTAGEQELLEILDGFLKWAGLDAKQQQPKSKLAQKIFNDLGIAGDSPEARIRIWNSMTLDQQRQFHEQFARGYEAYLRNGKAPTSALGRAFAKFKEWLLEIYKDASELDVEMTPEVYALYDRLFMSEMETKAETEGRHIIPLFTSAKAAGMSDDEFAKLKQAYDTVTEAIGASIRAGRERNHKLLASRVEREKLGLEKEFNDMIAQARKELEKSAVYRAWSMLDEGTTIEGIDFHSKLSRAEVTKILKGDTALIDALEAKGFLTDEASNFVPAKILADFAGARSAKQLVTDLAEMQPIEEEATEIAETRFMQQYGNLPNDEGLTRSAVVAVAAHDPSYSKALAYEYNALAKLTGSAKLAREGASKFAREKIGQQKISQLRPLAHARAEARAGKDAERAFRSGDLVGAAIHKRNQVVQHHIAKAGYDALTEIQRGIKFVKRALKSKSIYGSYMVQIENLAARFGLTNVEYNRGSKQLGEFLTEEEFPAGMVAEFLETDSTAMPYEQMTVEDFRELMDAIKMLVKTGREKNTVIIEGHRQSLKETVDSVKVSIEDNATKQKRDFETRYQKSKPGDLTKQSVLRFIHSHIKIASWARIMDGDKLGAMWNTFIRRANECGDRETELRHQLTKQLQEIFDPLLRQGGMHSEEVVLPTANRPLTRQERIAFALNWGNDGNRQRLKDGFGIGDQEADVILRSLSESEWRAVEQIWAVFEGLRPEMEALEVRLYGRPPRWIEYSPFDVVTSEGKTITVSGGYYPAVYDFDADERANKHEDMKQAESLMHKAARAVATDRSHMKKRAAHVERPISLLLSNCFDALNNEVHDLCWREYVIDAQRLLKGGVSEQIRGYYGADVARDFQKWLQDVALGEQRPKEGCEAWLSTLRQGVGLAGLGFNVVSAISQFTGLISTTSRLGAYTGVGLGQYIRNPIEATRQVCEQSLFMKNRGLTRFRELNEVNNRIRNSENRIEQTMDWMRTGGYWMLLKIQQIVDTITWLGAYQRAIDNNHTVEEARAMADQEVIDTQGSGMIKDQASVERGGPAMKMLTVFYSFMNTAYNLNMTAFYGDRNRYRATAKILTMTMVMPVVEGMLRGALPVDISDDDDDDITADMMKQAAQVINFNMGMLLGVRELATLSNVVSGEPIWSYQGPGGFRLIGDIYKATQQVAQGEYDAALVKSMVNLGGSMFGLPSAQINRVVSSEAEDLEGVDYARGALFGVKKN